MNRYTIDDYHDLQNGGDYWFRQNAGRWMPCVVIIELVGLEHRIELKSGWLFAPLPFWPEAPDMRDESYESIQLLGPMEQPDES